MICFACIRIDLWWLVFSDSPHLSLLIQNKGKDPVVVTISAPDFVRLDKTKVQLKEKDDAKVFVNNATMPKSCLNHKISSYGYTNTSSVLFCFQILMHNCLIKELCIV